MKFGYVRVRNREQNTEIQLNDLKRFGCETVIVDKDFDKNQIPLQLIRIVDRLQKGDVIVVWKLDALGLSLKSLIEFVSSFRERRGVEFISLQDGIDTETQIGRITFKILASLEGNKNFAIHFISFFK